MGTVEMIRNFATNVCGTPVVIQRERLGDGQYSMSIESSTPRLGLPKNLFAPSDDRDKAFRRNLESICPMARGFSNITISLLHECGHWATRDVYEPVTYTKMEQKAYTQQAYFNIPFEQIATLWAICWLQNPCNRVLAKDFERELFRHGR